MSAQSIYIGLQLTSPLRNQKRYEAVINEILQYLQMNEEELVVRYGIPPHIWPQALGFKRRPRSYLSRLMIQRPEVAIALTSLPFHSSVNVYSLAISDFTLATQWLLRRSVLQRLPGRFSTSSRKIFRAKSCFSKRTWTFASQSTCLCQTQRSWDARYLVFWHSKRKEGGLQRTN